MPTKRVATCLAMLGAGFALAMGGCGPRSPIVGVENGEVGDSSGASGNGSGTIDVIGNADVFASSLVFSGPGGEELCLPRTLPVDSKGAIACAVLSAHRVASGGECRCDDPGSEAASDGGRRVVEEQLEAMSQCGAETGVPCSDYCVCDVPHATGSSAVDCLTNPEPPPSSYGWCYIDDQGRGSPKLVENCPEGSKHKVRVLPEALTKEPGRLFFLACAGGALVPGTTRPGGAPVGEPCLMSSERHPGLSGFSRESIELAFGFLECASNICLVNHFQGRASCPYGQRNDEALQSPRCFLPGTDEPVTVPVDPQLVARPADETVICSCRCDGPDPSADYCTCPTGMECAPVVRDIGVPGGEGIVGSYCIHAGTGWDPLDPPPADVCRIEELNCGDPRPY